MIWCDWSRMVLLDRSWRFRGCHSRPWRAVLVVVVLIGRPFLAAENALLPDILSGEFYALGSGLRTTTLQVTQLVGFAGWRSADRDDRRPLGIVPRCRDIRFLGADRSGYSFVTGPRRRAGRVRQAEPYLRMVSSGVRLVFGDPRLRTLMLLAWLAAFYTAPEGLAAPLRRAHRRGWRRLRRPAPRRDTNRHCRRYLVVHTLGTASEARGVHRLVGFARGCPARCVPFGAEPLGIDRTLGHHRPVLCVPGTSRHHIRPTGGSDRAGPRVRLGRRWAPRGSGTGHPPVQRPCAGSRRAASPRPRRFPGNGDGHYRWHCAGRSCTKSVSTDGES